MRAAEILQLTSLILARSDCQDATTFVALLILMKFDEIFFRECKPVRAGNPEFRRGCTNGGFTQFANII